MEKISEILRSFEKISLTDLNSVKLMNRIDTKFATSFCKLPLLLSQLYSNYKILSIDDQQVFSFKTSYYDTLQLSMYLKHHNGALNRYKIRERNYLNNGVSYLEIKFKNNKGRTIKERIKRTLVASDFSEVEKTFINEKTPYSSNALSLKVVVNYSRITLVSKDLNEKITIDCDIHFSDLQTDHELKKLIIIEVKQSCRSKTPIFSILRDLSVKPLSISKYCLGVNFLYPSIKKNNFKEKLVTLNKIINDTSFIHTAGI